MPVAEETHEAKGAVRILRAAGQQGQEQSGVAGFTARAKLNAGSFQ
jgi:hypothetical protein